LLSPSRIVLRKISAIHISLIELEATIPTLAIHNDPEERSRLRNLHEAYNDAKMCNAGELPTWEDENGQLVTPFSLDDVFTLTQQAVDIYPVFIKTFFAPPSGSIAATSSTSPPDTTLPISGPRSPPPVPIPPSSTLALLAMHHQLLDVWMLLLSHIEYVTPSELGKHCLTFRLGSFQPSHSTLEIIMASELARMLREGVEGLVGVMERRYKEEANAPGGNATGNTGAENIGDKGGGREKGKGKGDEMEDESAEAAEKGDEMEADVPSAGEKGEEDAMQDAEKIDGKEEERAENPTLLVAKEVLRRAEGLVDRAEGVKQTIEEWRRKGLLEGKWKSIWAL